MFRWGWISEFYCELYQRSQTGGSVMNDRFLGCSILDFIGIIVYSYIGFSVLLIVVGKLLNKTVRKAPATPPLA